MFTHGLASQKEPTQMSVWARREALAAKAGKASHKWQLQTIAGVTLGWKQRHKSGG